MLELKISRMRKGLTQEELAEKIGMAKITISAYEIGRAKPSLDVLIKLSDVLEVSLDELLGRKEK